MKAPFLNHNSDRERLVRQVVESFYTAFNQGFEGACDFPSED